MFERDRSAGVVLEHVEPRFEGQHPRLRPRVSRRNHGERSVPETDALASLAERDLERRKDAAPPEPAIVLKAVVDVRLLAAQRDLVFKLALQTRVSPFSGVVRPRVRGSTSWS